MDKYEKYKLLKDSIHLKKNPFITDDFKINVSILEDKNTYTKHIENNRLVAKLPKKYTFERQLQTTVFRTDQTKRTVLTLKPNAKDLLFWIMYEIPRNTDYVIIDKNKYAEYFDKKLSIKTIDRAIKELTQKHIIKQSKEQTVYFINPNYFFAGTRKNKYPEKCKIYKPKSE